MTNKSSEISTLFSNEITESALSDLRERFPTDIVHDMTDEAQFKAARKVRTEKNKLTKAIHQRKVNLHSEITVVANDLTSEVESIFSTVVAPFERQLEINKEAKEKAERELKELLDGQRAKINDINKFVSDSVGKSSSQISGVIESVSNIDETMFHKDVIHEAIETKKHVQSRLADLLTQALNEESLQAEREALAKQQQEAAEAQRIADLKANAQERLNKLMMIPTGLYGKSSAEINQKISSLESYDVQESEFGELFNQANVTRTQVIDQLKMMMGQQVKVEDAEKAAATKAKEVEAELAPSPCEQSALADEIQSELNGADEPLFGESFSNAAPTLSGSSVFQPKEVKATLGACDESEHLEYFFGDKGMSDMATDDNGNEYLLEVVVRRVALKK